MLALLDHLSPVLLAVVPYLIPKPVQLVVTEALPTVAVVEPTLLVHLVVVLVCQIPRLVPTVPLKQAVPRVLLVPVLVLV
jgi:hypothetical protein